MSLFPSEIVTPPAHLPIAATDEPLAAAVVEEIERGVLWRAIVAQTRRIVIDGALPPRLEIEPVTAVVSLTRWTPGDAAKVIPAANYDSVTRDPAGTIIASTRGKNWPAPKRAIGSFALTYMAGWTVTTETTPGAGDAVNEVPALIQLLIREAVAFRAGSWGVGNLHMGSLKIEVADEFKTARFPASIASIGRAYAYRPGLFAARP